MKIRYVTNSPAEEYAVRMGSVRPLSAAIAGLLANASAKVLPTIQGITLQINGRRHTYWHPHSLICSDLSGPKQTKVTCTWSRWDPSVAHVFSLSGKYIESLPLKAQVEALGTSAENKKAFAESREATNRAIKHLEAIKRPDLEEAVDRHLANMAAIDHVVTQIPASRVPESADGEFTAPTANRAIAATNRIQSDREETHRYRAIADEADEHLAARGMAPATSRSVRSVRSVQSHRNIAPVAAGGFDPFDLD